MKKHSIKRLIILLLGWLVVSPMVAQQVDFERAIWTDYNAVFNHADADFLEEGNLGNNPYQGPDKADYYYIGAFVNDLGDGFKLKIDGDKIYTSPFYYGPDAQMTQYTEVCNLNGVNYLLVRDNPDAPVKDFLKQIPQGVWHEELHAEAYSMILAGKYVVGKKWIIFSADGTYKTSEGKSGKIEFAEDLMFEQAVTNIIKLPDGLFEISFDDEGIVLQGKVANKDTDEYDNTATVKKYKRVYNPGDKSLFPITANELLPFYSLSELPASALRLMRNDIFARYGYSFKSQDLKSLFNSMPWYKADSSVQEPPFSAIERINLDLIKALEARENQ